MTRREVGPGGEMCLDDLRMGSGPGLGEVGEAWTRRSDQTLNDSPQPHDFVALGFLN